MFIFSLQKPASNNKATDTSVKTKPSAHTNKTKDTFYNYEELDYAYNNNKTKHHQAATNIVVVTRPSVKSTSESNLINSLVTVENEGTPANPNVPPSDEFNEPKEDPANSSNDDVKGFYDSDIELDTKDTDYYDFTFKTKPKTGVSTPATATNPTLDLAKTKTANKENNNSTSLLSNFNLRELLKSPALLAGIFGGLLVGVITASLLLFFIIYRVKRRKFEETSYMINGTVKSARVHYPNPKRIYSRNHPSHHQNQQHVTLLSSSSLSPVANLSGAGSASSTNSATAGLLNGNTLTSSRLLKYTNPAQTLRKTTSNLSSDSGSSPNHDGAFNYAYIKAPTKEFYA